MNDKNGKQSERQKPDFYFNETCNRRSINFNHSYSIWMGFSSVFQRNYFPINRVMRLTEAVLTPFIIFTLFSTFNVHHCVIFPKKCDANRMMEADIKTIGKVVLDVALSKWNIFTPSHEQLKNEIQFWCIEP